MKAPGYMSTLHSADCRLLGAINSCDEELVLEACQRDGAALLFADDSPMQQEF